MTVLGDLVTLQGGGTPARSVPDYWNGDIPWASVKDLNVSRLTSTEESISEAGVAASATNVVRAGHVIVATRMAVGRASLLEVDAAINQDLKALLPKPGKRVHPNYLLHLLGASAAFLEKRATGATVKGIRGEVLEGLPVPHPDYEEQRRIADILDKADAIRRKRKEAIALTEELLRSAFLEMFGDPVTNPKSWPVKPLGDLVDAARGISYGVVQRGPEVDGGVPVVRISNFVDNRFDGSEVVRTSQEISNAYRRTILEGGELVVSIRGTVGRVAVVPTSARTWNVSREVAVLPLKHSVSRPLVHAALLSDGVQRFILGNVKGVAQSGINLADLRLAPIPLPPEREVTRFEACVRTIARLEHRTIDAGSEINTLFNSLVARAFSGALSS